MLSILGVQLALHPDDPPMPVLRGQHQVCYDYEGMSRALGMFNSVSNRLCFCQGSFASAGLDVVQGIERFASNIAFVHFRDVIGTVPSFRECWQDTGVLVLSAVSFVQVFVESVCALFSRQDRYGGMHPRIRTVWG